MHIVYNRIGWNNAVTSAIILDMDTYSQFVVKCRSFIKCGVWHDNFCHQFLDEMKNVAETISQAF